MLPMAGDQRSAPLLFATCSVHDNGTRHSPRLLKSFVLVSTALPCFIKIKFKKEKDNIEIIDQ